MAVAISMCRTTERFCLAPQMEAILADTQHPTYMGHMLRLFATYCSLDFLDHTEYLQTGEAFPLGRTGKGLPSYSLKMALPRDSSFSNW